jgi:hypothetical protein
LTLTYRADIFTNEASNNARKQQHKGRTMTTRTELQREILFTRWATIVESHCHSWRIEHHSDQVEFGQPIPTPIFQLGVSCGELATDVVWFDIDSTRELWIELGY